MYVQMDLNIAPEDYQEICKLGQCIYLTLLIHYHDSNYDNITLSNVYQRSH